MTNLINTYAIGLTITAVVSGMVFLYHYLDRWDYFWQNGKLYKKPNEFAIRSAKRTARYLVLSPLWFIYVPYKMIRFAFSK